MAISVTFPWAQNSLTGVTSLATSTLSPVAGVNIVGIYLATSVAVSNVTDNASRTYTTTLLKTTPGGANLYRAWTLLPTPLNGSTSVKITATLSATGNGSFAAFAIAGAAGTNPQDVSVANSGTSTAVDSGVIGTLNPNEVLLGFMACDTGTSQTFTPGTGWTNSLSNTNGAASRLPSNLMSQSVTSIGSFDAQCTIVSAGWAVSLESWSDTQVVPGGAPQLMGQICC